MAILIPNKLPRTVLKEVAQTFRKLRKLPDDFSVWYSMFDEGKTPHFLVIWKQHCGFIMHVTETSESLVETTIHGDLFDVNEDISVDSLGESERKVLRVFRENLPAGVSFPLKSIVVFPNVNRGTLDTVKMHRSCDTGVTFLDKQQLSDVSLADYLMAMVPVDANAVDLNLLRQAFTPEATILRDFTAKRKSNIDLADRNTNAQLTPLLLDVEQDWCTKNNLYLPPELEPISSAEIEHHSDIKCQLVTGVAGSGKSLVLLYRTLNSVKLSKGARVLVLTHNKPLLNELRERFDVLSKGNYQVTWLRFFQWAMNHLGSGQEVLYPNQVAEMIQDVLLKLGINDLSTQFIVDEIGFIKDLNIREKQQYLNEPRTGQKKGLNRAQREKVWSIFKAYQKRLEAEDKIDWHGVALRFYDKVMQGECGFPQYDCIFVDEAQFFAKSWFEIVKRALNPSGQLFLAADPTQGFLKRKQSWKASGLEVRGRSTRLQKAYRNSYEILSFATRFYKSRQQDSEQDEAINLLGDHEINMAEATGIEPEIIYCPNENDCLTRLIRELKALHSERKELAQPILIINANSFVSTSLLATLEQAFPQQIRHNKNEYLPKNKTFCQVSSLNAATGLESPIVFLLGSDHILEKENNPILSEDEKAEMITQNTQKLYMAFTRASTSLNVFTCNTDLAQQLETYKNL